jgi:hypothetical protein
MRYYKLYFLLFLIFSGIAANKLMAAQSLQFADPRLWNNAIYGDMSAATITIKPKGIMWEYTVEMTYSAKKTYYNRPTDTLEVQHYFTLPKEASVIDSWLWIDTVPVQAFIINKDRANTIYEGIVRRRRDPSILYKISDTQYEFRIFPMAGNVPRKAKLVFLMPASFTSLYSETVIPTNLFNGYGNSVSPEIIVQTDSLFHSPTLMVAYSYSVNTPFTKTGSNRYSLYISNQLVKKDVPIKVRLSSPLRNGVFVSTYKTDADSGYYQAVVLPRKTVKTGRQKKVVFIVDYEAGKSNASAQQVLDGLKENIHSSFTSTDSFNLFAGNLNGTSASNNWIPADSASIENAFAYISSLGFSSYSLLPSLISRSVAFVNAHDTTGWIHLSSNSNDFYERSAADALKSDILTIMKRKIPVHIFSFANQSVLYNFNSGTYYADNEYLYTTLANQTNGSFTSLRVAGSRYVNGYDFSLNTMTQLSLSIERTEDKPVQFIFLLSPDSGYCYQTFTAAMQEDSVFIQTGKYTGNDPIAFHILAAFTDTFISKAIVYPASYDADSITRLTWLGYYLKDLEQKATYYYERKIIQDCSIENRMLSTETAFLALEPNMDTTCTNCEPLPIVGLNEPVDAIQIKAAPNPFSTSIIIAIEGISPDEAAVIEISDMQGRSVYMRDDIKSMQQFSWDGTDNNGAIVANGVYMITVKAGNSSKKVKVVKM